MCTCKTLANYNSPSRMDPTHSTSHSLMGTKREDEYEASGTGSGTGSNIETPKGSQEGSTRQQQVRELPEPTSTQGIILRGKVCFAPCLSCGVHILADRPCSEYHWCSHCQQSRQVWANCSNCRSRVVRIREGLYRGRCYECRAARFLFCLLCGRPTRNQAALQQHTLQHKCPQCWGYFSQVQQHYLNEHASEKYPTIHQHPAYHLGAPACQAETPKPDDAIINGADNNQGLPSGLGVITSNPLGAEKQQDGQTVTTTVEVELPLTLNQTNVISTPLTRQGFQPNSRKRRIKPGDWWKTHEGGIVTLTSSRLSDVECEQSEEHNQE